MEESREQVLAEYESALAEQKQKLQRLSQSRSKFKRLLRTAICTLIGAYLALFVYALLFTEKTIFQPPSATYKDDAQILKLPSADGTPVSAIYLPGPHARYTLIYSHGNGEDLGQLLPEIKSLQAMGYSVLAYDYHGYGTTPGTPTEANAYADEEAAYNYLIKTRGVPANHILAIGHSLGAAMAIDLASRHLLGGLVVSSAFVSADRIVTTIPLLPCDKFQNLAKIGQVHCPVFILHGDLDGTVPVWHGRALFAAAHEPKRALWVPAAGHNNVCQVLGPRYEQELKDFITMIDTHANP